MISCTEVEMTAEIRPLLMPHGFAPKKHHATIIDTTAGLCASSLEQSNLYCRSSSKLY